MEPSKPITWISGLKRAYSSIGATQRDQYSWIAKSDKYYVFSVEVDHVNRMDNDYNHKAGYFYKRVPPMTTALGNTHSSISHSRELFNAALDAYTHKLKCRILLVKGSKFGTTKGAIKAAVEGHLWQVTELIGDISLGYSLKIERVE